MNAPRERLLNAYVQAVAGLGADEAVTLLRIGRLQSGIAHGRSSRPETMVVLPIGTTSMAEEYFRREPPTPYELEAAIAAVEDAVIPVRFQLGPESRLVTADPRWQNLLGRAGTPSSWPLESVEALFRELASAAHGAAVWRFGNDDAAAVLILREFMHHLGFVRVYLVPTRDAEVESNGD